MRTLWYGSFMATRIESELWTPAEAALELRCSVGSVKRWCRTGDISAVRTPGGHWRIPIDELRRLRTHRDHRDTDRPADLRGRL
jgi:excisionase family DNA binding protein